MLNSTFNSIIYFWMNNIYIYVTKTRHGYDKKYLEGVEGSGQLSVIL